MPRLEDAVGSQLAALMALSADETAWGLPTDKPGGIPRAGTSTEV